jgi:hypothetical protein
MDAARKFALLSAALLLQYCVESFGQSTRAQCESRRGTWDISPSTGEGLCIEDSQAKCKARGGTWGRDGILQYLGCVVPTKDGGKTCSDMSDCQVGCVYVGPYPIPAGSVTGQCAQTDNPFGCRSNVVKGKVRGRLCLD